MEKPKTLIIGFGEIGEALYECLKTSNEIVVDVIVDKKIGRKKLNFGKVEIMHICFPYSKEFVKEVKEYQRKYRPSYTIIHSTVPVGTSRKCGAIHSPVIGVHPYLERSLKTFTKFLGGEQASEVADYFRRANIKVYLTDKQETTELLKVLCTTLYGINIEYTKDVKRQCKKYGVPFEAWTLWTDNYNAGYMELGQNQFVRPNLIPIMKKTGGHCVLPNTKLIDTKFTRLIRLLNSENQL